MTRIILAIAIAFAIIAPGTQAFAQPSPADMEKAKKEFLAGKKAFDAGDFPEAASHFKTSYNLSKKPALLYNVALANESGGQDDIALFYYRKFLTDADPADAQRPDAETRVKSLEKKFGSGNTTTPTGNTTTTTTTPPEQHKEPTKLKPPGTYQPTEFQHQVVDAAPPKKALDVTAFVPEDSGWKVTLYYRTAGEGKFQSKEMRWRYKELVARIPPTKMIGESVQYYIEVKDPNSADAVVVRSGKATSPNLVELQAGAAERFYPDWNDETGTTQSAAEVKAVDEDEDPLNRNKKKKKVVAQQNPDGPEIGAGPERPGQGFGDVGSTKFKGMKWGATGVAAVGIGLSVVFFIQAGKQADAIEEDSKACGTPPCRAFNSPTDSYDVDVQAAGKRYDSLSTVSLVFGIAGAGIAGYYWYKEIKAKKNGEAKVSGKAAPSPETSWIFTPSAGDGYAGAAAAVRF
ncbi:MAG: hypothetical protein H0T46_03405 [Deltaproteobacteria bacterium]|nr:hypothetical protein [Deltaproteobacteria bacterium]